MSNLEISAPYTWNTQLMILSMKLILSTCFLLGIFELIGYFTGMNGVTQPSDITVLMVIGFVLKCYILLSIIANIYKAAVGFSKDFRVLDIGDLTEIQALSSDNHEIKKYIDAVLKQQRDLYRYDFDAIKAYANLASETSKLHEVRASLGFTE